MLTDDRKVFILYILFTLSVLALLICPFIGISDISIKSLLQRDTSTLDFSIYWNIRLPRVLLAFMVGATLSLCGMVFQAIFRNPLTTPSYQGNGHQLQRGCVGAVFHAVFVPVAENNGGDRRCLISPTLAGLPFTARLKPPNGITPVIHSLPSPQS